MRAVLVTFVASFVLGWVGPIARAGAGEPPRTRLAPSEQEGWLVQRTPVQWEDVPATKALGLLVNQFQRPIWTSDRARQRASQTRVHLVARHLVAFQVLNVLCRMAGLHWTLCDGVVAVTDAARTPRSWQASARALRSRLLAEHPACARTHVGNPTADLDLVDVTASAAIDRVQEAYELSLWAPKPVRTRQVLVTLRGKAMPIAETMTSLSQQLGVRAVAADGLFWLLPAAQAKSLEMPAPTSQATAPLVERADAGSREWTTLKTGRVTAVGWADDIRGVLAWRERHRGGAGDNPAVDRGAIRRKP